MGEEKSRCVHRINQHFADFAGDKAAPFWNMLLPVA